MCTGNKFQKKRIYIFLNSVCVCVCVNESLPICLQTSILAPITSESLKSENSILSPSLLCLRTLNGLSFYLHEIGLSPPSSTLIWLAPVPILELPPWLAPFCVAWPFAPAIQSTWKAFPTGFKTMMLCHHMDPTSIHKASFPGLVLFACLLAHGLYPPTRM